MEVSVRHIFLPENGFKPALCFRGRKVAHCVINDETIVRCIQTELADHDHARFVAFAGDIYPPEQFKSQILTIAARKGITQRAKMLLETMNVDQDTELPPDDPVQSAPDRSTKTRPDAPSAESGVTESSGRQSSARAGGKDELVTQRKGQPPKRSEPPARSSKREAVAPTSRLTTSRQNASTTRASGATADRGKPVHRLADELKITPVELRIRLRAVGLKAPYDDLAKMRTAVKNYKPPVKKERQK